MASEGQFVELDSITLAHDRVSINSVVRASDQITEGRGFKSHLELGFFPSSPYICYCCFMFNIPPSSSKILL